MQLQELTYLMQHPEALNTEQTDAIKKIVDAYPYFQPARALYLKGLKNKESYKYNNALKVTAAYTTDRSVLFDYITSEVFNQNAISDVIKQNSEYLKDITVTDIDDISVNKSVTIDDALKQHIKATEGVLDPHLFEEKIVSKPIIESENAIENAIIDIDVKNIKPETKLNLGKPLEFNKSETHSFAEWLKITSFKPIIRNDDLDSDVKTTSSLDAKMTTIDRFLDKNPKIKPSTKAPKPKLVNNDDASEDLLMTETLARIYLEQKNYDKAIQSYRILSLKYPEKSSFFADQIKAVKELREHNNTEQ
ncbi:hypothetical protein [Winogradskyella immobilis]|uniref:Tetratricopeptide repeat protein n=1 Tax=Winogradskyella immobilis TaxID=2816852 RepID=A0ABS8EM45_9FLAO|nr:hypothetical protein [Winogradskyella immobilis]MCC1484001.1 hypothetical protein [Winogradskyella immobilis]MCG0016093.1 hypothetical protein [Winogradskyella immobilis]